MKGKPFELQQEVAGGVRSPHLREAYYISCSARGGGGGKGM